MGYFNIFYKITRIIDMLTRKRNRKFIFILLMVIGIIFLLHNKGYCAQDDATFTTDTSYFIVSEYDGILDTLLFKFYNSYNKNTNDTNVFNNIFNYLENGYYPYVYRFLRPTDNVYIYRIYFYKQGYSMTIFDTSLVYNDYMRVPSTGFNVTIPSGSDVFQYNSGSNNMGGFVLEGSANAAIPQILLYKIPKQFFDMMSYAGRISSDKDIVDIKALLQAQNQKLDTINDSLTNTTYDDSVVDFDTDSVDNVDDTEITGLFTGVIGSFSNALNTYGGTITKIIPLPHGGQIEIPSNIVSSHLGNLTALVEAFWYFVFGIYLFRFVSNLIHKIKTGDILNGYTNDNEIITSSML